MLELDLREALASDQFLLYFQPLVDLRNGRVTTCEALLRWNHPTRGMVPPSVFIPIAEETGLIIALGEWALLRACFEAAKWPKSVRSPSICTISRPRPGPASRFGPRQVRSARATP